MNIHFVSRFFSIVALFFMSHTIITHEPIDQASLISKIMDYPMGTIMKRCQKDFGYDAHEIKILEKELKRYLSLVIIERSMNQQTSGMYSTDVDNLWHTFILFTKEYTAFSETFTGKYIHHAPNIDDIDNPDAEKTEAEQKENAQKFKIFITNYEKFLQEKAHAIWFLDGHERAMKKKLAPIVSAGDAIDNT